MAGLTFATAALLAACGGSSSSSAPPTTTGTSTTGTSTTASGGSTTTTGGSGSGTLVTNPSQWLSYDSTARTVNLTVNAADGTANGGFNFNGYANGQMVVTVPTGWKVTVNCKNEATAVNHSCAIVQSEGDTTPAFPGASTPDPTTGLSPGASATFDFTPTLAGDYRIDCLVPGHDPAGMWATLKVVESGTPSVSTTGTTTGTGGTGQTTQNS
jgi:sulfocyanin